MILPKARLCSKKAYNSAFISSYQHRHVSHSLQTNRLLRAAPFATPPSFLSHPSQLPARARMDTACRASSSISQIIPDLITTIGQHPIKAAGSFAAIFALLTILKYRNAIQTRLRQVREESWLFGAGVTMQRVADQNDGSTSFARTGLFANLKLLELNADFQAKCKAEGHQVISLGDYMSQLRPKGLPKRMTMDDFPQLIQREIEAGLAAGLLKILGPNLGRALLPAVGTSAIQGKAEKLAGGIFTRWFMSDEGSISASDDKGGLPIAIMTLLAVSDLNAKINSGKTPVEDGSVANMGLSAIDKMKVGEVVKGPAFVEGLDDNYLVPKDFVISKHFEKAIDGMENILAGHDERGEMTSTELKLAQDKVIQDENEHHNKAKDYKAKQQKLVYDPEDRHVGEPVPVNPRLFPGLHLGWGNALNSHTKREVVKMRLLSILLNRLGANYFRRAEGEPESNIFQLRMNPDDNPITTPWQFIQALQDSGHKVEMVPTSRMTTFGMALCVKEEDGSWTNVPLGIFLETGYEDKDGNMAPAMVPHSGLDMFMSGPLAGSRADGTPSELRLQHFVGIEGFCGWHPHSNPEVPFNEAIERGERLSGEDAVRAARVAGLYANCLNGLATQMELPFGGYGLTAVCNDSAALVQECLYGVNTIYPMTSIGRFMLKTMRYADNFHEKLEQLPAAAGSTGMERELDDLRAIVRAMKKIPSDLNASPSLAHSAATRLLATLQPSMPLRLMKDSRQVMESILEEDIMQEVNGAGSAPSQKVREVEKESIGVSR